MNNSLRNSVEILDNDPQRNPSDLDQMQQTQTEILNSTELSNDVKIGSQKTIVDYADPIDDPFKIYADLVNAELNGAENDKTSAMKYIVVSM